MALFQILSSYHKTKKKKKKKKKQNKTKTKNKKKKQKTPYDTTSANLYFCNFSLAILSLTLAFSSLHLAIFFLSIAVVSLSLASFSFSSTTLAWFLYILNLTRTMGATSDPRLHVLPSNHLKYLQVVSSSYKQNQIRVIHKANKTRKPTKPENKNKK